MPYCNHCGNPYEAGRIGYCPKCGAALPTPSHRRSPGRLLFVTGSILLVAALVAPFLYRWLLGDCGAIHLQRAFNEFSAYEKLLIDFETASENNARPPAYLVSQLYGATKSLANRSFDECFQPAADAMRAALLHAGAYYDYYSQQSGSPNREHERSQLDSQLRNYYSDMAELRACQPFCNIDKVFDLTSESPFVR